VRTVDPRQVAHRDFRRRVERLAGLPLRPGTARFVLAEVPEDLVESPPSDLAGMTRWRAVVDFDPGWAVAGAIDSGMAEPLRLVADRPWWPSTSRAGSDALSRLWRHAAAVALAARRLAREANDPEPDRVARAGLLHSLGLWAISALDPEWLARWFAITELQERRDLELRELGMESGALGRMLAERWGCDPLVADAAWLLGNHATGLVHAAAQPRRLAILQEAYLLAERTPWCLAGDDARELGPHDSRVKLLIAEVQSRCGAPFLDSDASPREEQLVRSNARLRLRVAELSTRLDAADRFLTAFSTSDPTDDPDGWADRASLAWCAEPGVSAARVVWQGINSNPLPPSLDERPGPPTIEISLGSKGRSVATVQVWTAAAQAPATSIPGATLAAWQSWADLIADRARLEERLGRVTLAYRRLSESEEPRLRAAKLEALAEFAAGAGHELNNPLAVIVGRAQLLIVRETDPKIVRSLRAILSQAQRAHRILRDLMFVARPPEPRPRYCQPDDIVRASVRDARHDAEDREVRLSADALNPGARVWTDPDSLRHLADSLLRNALEATPRGGQVRFESGIDAAGIRWSIHDSGRGISQAEGGHLFDPFYCGRQAGRGLGMGLPRASRFVTQVGGDIRWHSTPGQGSTFQVGMPLVEPPGPPGAGANRPDCQAIPAAE
jgi:signal transduction histidine kinase